MVRRVSRLFTPGVPLSPRVHVSLIFIHQFAHCLSYNFGTCLTPSGYAAMPRNYAASGCSSAGAPFNPSFKHPSLKSFDPWIVNDSRYTRRAKQWINDSPSHDGSTPSGDSNIMIGQASKTMKENIV